MKTSLPLTFLTSKNIIALSIRSPIKNPQNNTIKTLPFKYTVFKRTMQIKYIPIMEKNAFSEKIEFGDTKTAIAINDVNSIMKLRYFLSLHIDFAACLISFSMALNLINLPMNRSIANVGNGLIPKPINENNGNIKFSFEISLILC